MEKIDGKIYLKQAELAKRWRCSEGSIINYRKKGLIEYFQLPESTKILYLFDNISDFEERHTIKPKSKGGDKHQNQKTEQKVKPCVSTSEKDWRI